MKYRIALLIGRFQPFHFGHLYLLKNALKIADQIVVGVGSASIFDENNPLSYEERKRMLEKIIEFESLKDRVIKIVPLEDFFDDEKWLKNVEEQVGKFNIAVSNNDWTNKIMEQSGYTVKRFPYYKRELYEGWRIRRLVRQGKNWQERIPDYLISNFEFLISKLVTSHQQPVTSFNYIVLGGTFDRFHKGHEELIKVALKYGKKVTIGIATEELYKDKLLSKTIESYAVRKKNVLAYVYDKFSHDRVKTCSFSEFTGGADKNKNIDAIIVSRLTYPNALKINDLREKNKLTRLRIVIVKDVLAEDGELLSSERIRAGEIDRNGRRYELNHKRNKRHSGLLAQASLSRIRKTELILPEAMREELRKPLGKVYKNTKEIVGAILESPKKPTIIIAVGDIIVDSLLRNKIDPDVKVIDFRSRRTPLKRTEPFKSLSQKVLSLKNKPGTINLKTAEKLRTIIKGTVPSRDSPYNSWLIVEGEEDLLTLPAILFAPLGSLVLYGHWQLGIVAVEVTEEMKEKVRKIIRKFN
ncbi:MAG: hypothetical protein US40_C0011G0018 [Candidatus Roizmanbacteria bacterium GW2011_GWC2_37_13]|uniref:Cytidyltransferase-like domain-containing protein n=1 Tax=Candidatus Roizmanbacteria bacterium GW2011_GWC2_37_13 TaxID=1618486 RepID=A0A0G0G1V1_9BACT|nr:MAG: hypothetical protein US38_C0007G0018 [Candidatus Roizmanbacteria bacterium GW2011_GWC1_37_12]KKQ25133.1 MAG: hypothetical protein US40_C0011G0018 [Candidatus Roizmanbacteria bacterium GW2011_GWC2_37_13]